MGLWSWLTEPPRAPEPSAISAPAEAHTPAAAEPDSPFALRGHLAEVIAIINRGAGALPNTAVVLGRAITDTVQRVLDHPEPLSIETRISLYGILTDYLPTTLRTHQAAARAGHADEPGLQEQLTLMHTAALDLLGAVQSRDARAAAVQGEFLRTKFTGSDLDL